ncbi:AraC family transcriptional regulator [Maridesulfovibrio zosterae]|uniref:AraC family transcriptional regulator n=1 Tax=Maridesulfovibrio zosterae TaxID=82171 RepID=UPI00040529C9|nr:AraC family transcriptional regulator [Maridesulfovibrio zosterae]
MSNLIRPYNERMMEVMLYIQRNLDGDLSPEILAELACFSVIHFHRIFKGMVGETLKEHVRRLRLEQAAYNLTYTDKSILNIALGCKFESSETFSRAFKKMFKIPPREFRIQAHERINPDGKKRIHYHPVPTHKEIKFIDTDIINQVEIRKRKETMVAFIRHVGSYFDVKIAWDKLCSWASIHNLNSPETEYLGICYDDPNVTPKGKIRYDACVTITAEIEPHPEIGIQIIPCSKYAVAIHRGPYERLIEAYQNLYGKWLPKSGFELRNSIPSFEKYLKTPDQYAPEDLLTEIWLGVY